MKETEKLLGKKKKSKNPHSKFGISLRVVRAPLKTRGMFTAKFTPKAAELDSAPYATARADFAGRIHSLRCINASSVKHSMTKKTVQINFFKNPIIIKYISSPLRPESCSHIQI